mgnify:CR=1 FL=1|tara:strand:- start:814 stop:1743 length:930 start_codon:yes stop_codon:yes gene_type:complete
MVNELLVNLVNKVLGRGKHTARGNRAYSCPYCNHKNPKLEINFDDSVKGNPWHCWVCDKKGTKLSPIFKQAKASEDIFSELYKLVKSEVYREVKREVADVKLPKEFKSLLEITRDDLVGRRAMAYLKKRGITKYDILKYNIGYCIGGLYNNMVVIPSYDHEGKLNYFTARNFNPHSNLKYKNPPTSRDIIPFELYVNWSSPLVLCEGPFDALSIKRNVIPLLGKQIQRQLMKKIVTSEVKKIYIALDKDAMKDALRHCELLLNEGKEVYLVDLEDKDPNEMGFEAFTELIQNTYPLSQYDLMERKLQLI